MNIGKRILLTAAAFCVVTLAMVLIAQNFGIATGTWKSAILAGVIAAVTGGAWRMTAPKN